MTPEERMYKFMSENLEQFREKTLDQIILLHRQHEHEATKTQFIIERNNTLDFSFGKE